MLAFIEGNGRIRQTFPGGVLQDGNVVVGEVTFTCPSVCVVVDYEPLADGEIPRDPRCVDPATMREIPESDPEKIQAARYDAFNRAHANAEDIEAFDALANFEEFKAWFRPRFFSASRRRDLGML